MKDDRPEFVHYKDEGCELAPSCLECPREKCVFDEPGETSAARRRRQRNEEIKARWKRGDLPADLAKEYRVNRRTIERILTR